MQHPFQTKIQSYAIKFANKISYDRFFVILHSFTLLIGKPHNLHKSQNIFLKYWIHAEQRIFNLQIVEKGRKNVCASHCTLTFNFSSLRFNRKKTLVAVLVVPIRYFAESFVQMLMHYRVSHHCGGFLRCGVYQNHTDIYAATVALIVATSKIHKCAFTKKGIVSVSSIVLHISVKKNGWIGEWQRAQESNEPWEVVQIFENHSVWRVTSFSCVCRHLHSIKILSSFRYFCCILHAHAYINEKTYAFHRNRSHGKGHMWFGISWLLFFVLPFCKHAATHTTNGNWFFYGMGILLNLRNLVWNDYPSRSHCHRSFPLFQLSKFLVHFVVIEVNFETYIPISLQCLCVCVCVTVCHFKNHLSRLLFIEMIRVRWLLLLFGRSIVCDTKSWPFDDHSFHFTAFSFPSFGSFTQNNFQQTISSNSSSSSSNNKINSEWKKQTFHVLSSVSVCGLWTHDKIDHIDNDFLFNDFPKQQQHNIHTNITIDSVKLRSEHFNEQQNKLKMGAERIANINCEHLCDITTTIDWHWTGLCVRICIPGTCWILYVISRCICCPKSPISTKSCFESKTLEILFKKHRNIWLPESIVSNSQSKNTKCEF